MDNENISGGDYFLASIVFLLAFLGVWHLIDAPVDAWFFSSPPAHISGRVVEKLEASTGYSTVHILKVERASERHIYIVVNAQTWHSVLQGVEYKFETGDKGGYNSAVEMTRE